jgi:putative transposase
MVRALRIEFSGAMYHITSRGNRREPIVLTEGKIGDYL